MRGVLADLADLVFPADCPGCGMPGPASPLCRRCGWLIRGARARIVRPTPAPAGLPRCAALGDYRGVLRELVLGYKERGRLGLAAPLGSGLAVAVLTAAPPDVGLILVPVPSTAAAARARGGDHVRRLTRRAVRDLRRAGRRVTVHPALTAVSGLDDSATLDATGRARRAMVAFRPCRAALARLASCSVGGPASRDPPGAGVPVGRAVIVVDDIVTTGCTLAAVSTLLSEGGVRVAGAAVVAATRRRVAPASAPRPGGHSIR